MPMTSEQFGAWRKSMGINKTEAARLLGLSPFSIRNYEKGKRREPGGRPVEIPRPVDLACMALSAKLKGWSEYPR